MNPEYFRKFARQCRELIRRARSDTAREQLSLWADEFEAEAHLIEARIPLRPHQVDDSG